MVSAAPAFGWLLNRLVARSGHYALADHDLLAFALSPQGALFLLLGAGLILTLWFAEQVGLPIFLLRATRRKNVSVSLVLWQNLTHLPALLANPHGSVPSIWQMRNSPESSEGPIAPPRS